MGTLLFTSSVLYGMTNIHLILTDHEINSYFSYTPSSVRCVFIFSLLLLRQSNRR